MKLIYYIAIFTVISCVNASIIGHSCIECDNIKLTSYYQKHNSCDQNEIKCNRYMTPCMTSMCIENVCHYNWTCSQESYETFMDDSKLKCAQCALRNSEIDETQRTRSDIVVSVYKDCIEIVNEKKRVSCLNQLNVFGNNGNIMLSIFNIDEFSFLICIISGLITTGVLLILYVIYITKIEEPIKNKENTKKEEKNE